MNYSDLSSKLTQVIEQVPKDVLYDFCCSYAQEHEELAMALVNEFWRPEKDDYRSMVQQCLMHPTPAGIKNGDASALERDFGFTPKITLREGLRKFAEWYKCYYRNDV